MSFDKFGKISFVPSTKVSNFVTYLKENQLMGTKCKKCSTIYFPPRADCSNCMGSEMDWIAFKGKGKLLTYTTIHYAPTGFEKDAPYTIALVELQEGGRLIGWLEGVQEKDIRIGMELKIVPKPLPDDKISYVIKP